LGPTFYMHFSFTQNGYPSKIYSKSSFIRHAWGMGCANRSILPKQRTVTYDTQL
jgi:hypothetical protein